MIDLSGERAEQKSQGLELPSRPFVIALVAGLLTTIVYPLQFGPVLFPGVFAVAFATAGTALALGFFFGFLFGIPRTLQGDRPEPASLQKDAISRGENSPAAPGTPSYSANTNLEQISDWLTKILVGVSLTQIGPISQAIRNLIEYLRPGLGDADSSSGFALTLLVYFFTIGFLFGFLWTRLALPVQFASADREVIQAQINESREKINEVADRDRKNAEAKIAAFKATDSAEGVSVAKLKEKFSEATKATRLDIYTATVRDADPSPVSKKKRRGTIDILKALAEIEDLAKPEDKFLGNNVYLLYGNIGFLLKAPGADSSPQDLQEATAALDEAIAKRPPALKSSSTVYELARAMSRIFDPERAENERDEILEDLKAVAQKNGLTQAFLDEERNARVKQWLEDNSLSVEKLSQL